MEKFLKRLTVFSLIVAALLLVGGFLPVTPRAAKTLLFAKIKKDSLLIHTQSPRVIFVGGSNLSFGLNSQMIKDSLALDPVNTSIHASLGLEFMLNSAVQFLKKGDIVVLSAEYDQFFGNFAYGDEELLRLVMDIEPKSLAQFSKDQWLSIYPFFPKYLFSKYNPVEYLLAKENLVYGVNSFNQYGDASAHWKLNKESFAPYGEIQGEMNNDILEKLKLFEEKIKKVGAKMYVTFPSYQQTSFDFSQKQIASVDSVLKKEGFNVISVPDKYRLPDSLFFNSPYHLTKTGVDLRTSMLIADIKNIKQ